MWFSLSQRKATIFGTLTNLCSGEGGETAEKTCPNYCTWSMEKSTDDKS